jgi:hypothetical protein
MRNRFLVYLVANFLLLFFILWTSSTNNAQNQEAGKIEKIDCKAYWRKTEKSKEEALTKKDEGRTLYVDEGVRCAGKGALHLLVYGQPVNVDASKDWYNLPENNAGNDTGTGGRRGEELTWMTGTYRLNQAESDTSASQMQFLKKSIGREIWQYENGDRSPSDSTPLYLAFKPENQKLTFWSSETPPLSFSTDGQMRTSSLKSGDSLQLQATAAKDHLDITWILNDVVTVLVNVRPIENGKKLILNWIIRRKDNPTPQQFKTIYERASSEAYLDIYKYRQGSGETAAAATGGGDEMIVAELLEPLSLKAPNPASVRLRIIEPESLKSIIGVEVKTQAVQTARGPVVALQFHAIRAIDSRVEPLTVALGRVVTASGEVLVERSAIRQQIGDPTTVVFSGIFEFPAGARFILRRL